MKYENDFYRYIYPNKKGWRILKDNQDYGTYPEIKYALYERDRLESVNWDIQEWVYLPPSYNEYENIILPPRGLRRCRQYIRWNNGKWSIQKKINGKIKYFGRYNTLEEAVERRNELYRNGWEL